MTLDLENQIVDTWNINNRINLYLLEAIPPDALSAGPELLEGLEKIEKETAADKKLLARSLNDSGKAMETLLKKSLENGGKIKGFKPHVTAFLGYLVAHESQHRGQIALSLKQSGHALDKKVAYGIWEWGVR